ncbi:MAG: hypothetical protein AB7V14_11610 [Kiritimatiellia bacterium]
MKTKWILAVLLMAGTDAAPAADSRAPGEESASVGYLATSRVGFDDPENPELSGRVSVQESAACLPLAHRKAGGVELAAGAWAGWTRLDFRGHPELGTEDLYGLAAILAAARPAESGWGWSALVLPGFYSDFRGGRTGEGKILVHAAAEYAFSAAWRAQFGLAYDTAFGDPALYPVGGFVWQAMDTLAVRFVAPAPSVYWAPNAAWGFFANLQPAGDRWIVDDDADGEQEFLIECWRAGLGVERRLGRDIWLRLAAGTEFDRRYEASAGDRRWLDDAVDDAAFASLALVVY